MERINANEVQSIMEAYASIYEKKGEDCVPKSEKGTHNCAKKVCHEEFGQGETIFGQHAEPDENGFVSHYDVQFEHGIVENVSVEDMEVLTLVEHPGHGKKKTMYAHTEVEGEVLEENPLNYLGDKFKKGAQQIKGFFSPGPGVNPNRAMSARGSGRAAFRDSNMPPKTTTGGNTGSGMTPAQVKAAQDAANKARQQGQMSDLRGGGGNTGRSPISNLSNALDKPSVVSPKTGETTKFERRLPTMAELRAAQAARAKAKAGGATDREAGYQAVKAGVGVSKGTVKDPKIAADAKRKAELEAIRARAKADTMAKAKTAPAMSGRARMREELDVFDTIKEYLIGEGATEEEALKQMLTLTDEQRTEIIEGSCGSKPKKKGGKK